MLEIVTFNTLLMLACYSSLGLRFDIIDVTADDNLEVRSSVMNITVVCMEIIYQ